MAATRRIEALTGLRFVAAFSILFGHAFDWIFRFSDSDVGRNFSFVTVYAMPLFFVLSGFVIHYNYAALFSRERYAVACWQFGVARFARIYPLFFVLLVFASSADSFFNAAAYNGDLILRILGRCFTLTATWKYSVYNHRLLSNWLFGLSWSVSTEWFFYVAYALLFFRLAAFRSARSAFTAVAVFVMLAVAVSVWGANHRDIFALRSDSDFDNSFYRWALYFSPYARLPEFILGCLAAQAYLTLKTAPSTRESRIGMSAMIASIAFLVWGGWAWLHIGPPHPIVTKYMSFMCLNFGFAPALAIVMFCAARYESSVSRFLSCPEIVALGERSYSIYLVQAWTVNLVSRVPAQPFLWWTAGDALIRVLIGICATFVVADATYRLIEVPARRWIRMRMNVSKFLFAKPSPSLRSPSVASTSEPMPT